MKEKYVEWGKSLVLTALLFAMLLQSAYILVLNQLYPASTGTLSGFSMLLRDIRSTGTRQDSLQGGTGRELWPSGVVLLSDVGDSMLLFRSENEAAQVSEVLGLAVEILKDGRPFYTDQGFLSCLEGDGLLIDLGRLLPVDVALLLMGEAAPLKFQTRYLLLTETEDGVMLSMDGEHALCYTLKGDAGRMTYRDCRQQLAAASGLTPVQISGRSGNPALETATIYASRAARLQTVTAKNSLFDESGAVETAVLQKVLPVFSYNVSTPRRDVEQDGTLVYVENYSSLRLSPEGALHFRASETRHGVAIEDLVSGGGGESFSAGEVMLAGYALIDQLLSGTGDPVGAGLRFTGSSFSARENKLYLYYDYVACGLPVYCDGYPHAATLCYEGGFFSDVQMLFRSYAIGRECRLADFDRQWRMAELSTGLTPTTAQLCYEDRRSGGELLPTYRFGIRELAPEETGEPEPES